MQHPNLYCRDSKHELLKINPTEIKPALPRIYHIRTEKSQNSFFCFTSTHIAHNFACVSVKRCCEQSVLRNLILFNSFFFLKALYICHSKQQYS